MTIPKLPTYTQLAPNSTGDKVDEIQLVNTSGDTVKRQVSTLGDPTNVSNLQAVNTDGAAMVTSERMEFQLQEVVSQLRMINLHLAYLTGLTLDDQEASLAIFN